MRRHVHLVMELCPGMPLYHHVKKMPDRKMPEDTCKVIFRQLVMGIGFMHEKGKAHRDLKLDNVLWDAETQKIKIIDFGFSLHASKEALLSVFCGTPHYMDPDIAAKRVYSPFAADVWAAGVILYIIICGKLPFFADFETDLFRKIQSGKFATEFEDQNLKILF